MLIIPLPVFSQLPENENRNSKIYQVSENENNESDSKSGLVNNRNLVSKALKDQSIIKKAENSPLAGINKDEVTGFNGQATVSGSETSQVNVKLDYITILNDHDGFFRGKGEFVNYAYVQGKRLVLNMHVDTGQSVTFSPDKQVTVALDDNIPLAIFTVGNEDDCNVSLAPEFPPEDLTELQRVFKDSSLDWTQAISDAQSQIFQEYLTCDGDKLGTITEIYQPPTYNVGPHIIKSSNGDFNLKYTISISGGTDSDQDGVSDIVDNCPTVSNKNQLNSDRDKVGNVCDPDDDNDGDLDPNDNCKVIYNPDQNDQDDDGKGDKCDPDADGDGTPDRSQRFPEREQTID